MEAVHRQCLTSNSLSRSHFTMPPVEEMFDSLSIWDKVEKPTQFDDVPDDAKKHILSLLPVVDIMHCRVVCREWKALVTSCPDSSPSEFLKNFWVENRPEERWLFLHDYSASNANFLYDVRHEVCYNGKPNPSVEDLAVVNTTVCGLLFLARHIYSTSILNMWVYNPVTGCQNQLPDISSNFLPAIISAHEDATTRPEPHYKILLLEFEKFSLTIDTREVQVHVYSSKERRWQAQQNIRTHILCHLCEVQTFRPSDLIYLLESPEPLGSPHNIDWRADVNSLCRLRWFNVEGYTWDSCPISPPQDTDAIYDVQYFFLFERNMELILLAALATEDPLAVEFRVYKSCTTITAGVECSWMYLSSMSEDISSGPQPSAAAEGSSQPQFQLESRSYAEVFPLPDKEEGDKLIIILMGIDSYRAVVSYNLESPAEDAWKTLLASTDVGNVHTSTCTTVEEKIIRWSKSAIAQFKERTVSSPYPVLFQSGSFQGFTFEPRLDDLQADQPGHDNED